MAITSILKQKPSSLWRALRVYQIYGANTDIGKTIMSTVLTKAFARRNPNENIWYLKPISTGYIADADDGHVSKFSPQTKTRCLFQFDEAVSPHIAARSTPLSDGYVLASVQNHLSTRAKSGPGIAILETAGGVHSPTPSGSSQADLYRPLRLPVCLVADHRLGGISATVSAFESLHIRGYDLDAVLQFEDERYQNYTYLHDYFEKKGILSLSIPPPPNRCSTIKEDIQKMSAFYDEASKLDAVDELIEGLMRKHETRIRNLEELASKAHKHIWYPFTQHQHLSLKSIMTIDSAYGDFFRTRDASNTGDKNENGILESTFDGSASWWTQGIGHGNPDLSLSAAYAAGRYGHVMFAGAIHEPAMKLATTLLENLGNPRLQRVFFSDNGSTGMEVATKMALTASTERYKWSIPKEDIGILGLKGSYHGDTIGAMDCSEPSIYNDKVHWHQGRGYWFDFPQVKMKDGCWIVEPPKGMEDDFGEVSKYSSLTKVFDIMARVESPLAAVYRQTIKTTLDRLIREGKTFGALIMEPVILGAGGMLFVDPLFQHSLVQVIRSNPNIFTKNSTLSTDPTTTNDPHQWAGLPVLFDEVFTGLYRLGRFSSSSFLQIHPDISCHAKLLTGGLVPLCTTLASDSIYKAFLGKEKKDALLHGHSYTAHAVGCEVANESLKIFMQAEKEGKWNIYKEDWGNVEAEKLSEQSSSSPGGRSRDLEDVWSVWSKGFVQKISMAKEVESVVALGSVLAISLLDNERAGYNSSAASGLQKKLSENSGLFKIHSRVLGNVFYLMASQTSEKETLLVIEKSLLDDLI